MTPKLDSCFHKTIVVFVLFNEIPKLGSHTSTHKSNLPKALQDVHFLGDLSHVWQVPPVEQALHRPQPPATALRFIAQKRDL